jgi:hypothetical protein
MHRMTTFPRYYLRRSEYAELWGVSPTTLLRYEEWGWLTPEYSPGGHRYYPAHIPPRQGKKRRSDATTPARPGRHSQGPASYLANSGQPLYPPSVPRRSMSSTPSAQVRSFTTQTTQQVRETTFRQFLARLNAMRSSPLPVALSRIDDTGERELATVPGLLFSLEWVKRTFGGGHFRVDGFDFWVEGSPKPYW